MATEKLFDIWARRNPNFEKHFEESLLRNFTDYGIGASELTSSKGKMFGAAYELYIYAFFIGLYNDKKKPLTEESKILGQPIQYWGNLDSKKNRKAYPRLREYMFVALIAKTEELDLLLLEKGEITERKAVDLLINTMEQYANFGFYSIKEKLNDNPNYFYKNTGFLDFVLGSAKIYSKADEAIEEL